MYRSPLEQATIKFQIANVLLSVALTGAVAPSAHAQAPRRAPTTSADAVVITGRVVTDSTGDPIRNARVTLFPESQETPVVLTDAAGAFRLTALLGRFSVVASKTGYARGDASPAVSGRRSACQAGEDRLNVDVIVPMDQLSGMPAALFALRFLRPRQDSAFQVPPAQSSAPRPTDGSVRGRVDSIDGTPISLAQVYLFASINAESSVATTDEDGRFEFGAVAAGTLLVSVTKTGYTQVESGQALQSFPMGRATSSPTPNDVQFGRRFELTAASTESVDLQMALRSSLSGTVTDEYGDPIQGVEVQVLRVQFEAGRRRLVPAGASRLTDDLGRYRLYGLVPGRYIVSAAVGQVSSDDLPGYGRSYFPGSPNPGEAQYVSVGLAQDVGFVDFSMSRMHTARVAGIVLDPTGEPAVPGALTLAPSQRSPGLTSVAVGARIAPDGTFVFPNVPSRSIRDPGLSRPFECPYRGRIRCSAGLGQRRRCHRRQRPDLVRFVGHGSIQIRPRGPEDDSGAVRLRTVGDPG